MRMKSPTIAILGLLLLASAACRHDEQSVTGSFGSAVVNGKVTMAGGGSPAGVQVSVAGTGMATTLGEDGHFAFIDVPQNATLRFRRSDGIDTTVKVAGQNAPVAVTLNDKSSGGKHRASSPNPFLQVDGTIKSADATTLVVTDSHGTDTTLQLTKDTTIRSEDTKITAADLVTGNRVHALFSSANNVNTAVLVVMEGKDDDANEHHGAATANGVVTSTGASSIVVHRASGDDITVQVTSSTIIRKNGAPITLGDIKAGDHVQSVGTAVDAHTISATQIEVESENADNNAKVSGTIASISGSAITVGTTTVNTTATTRITRNDKTATVADLQVGDRIQASGTRVDDHTITATEIEAESAASAKPVELSGTVASVGATSFMIGTQTINVTSATHIIRNGKTAALTDLQVGDKVEVLGTRADATTIDATVVEAEAAEVEHNQKASVSGTVSDVTATGLVVGSGSTATTVNVDATTRIRKDGRTLALADINKGDRVSASGTRVDDHTILAAEIEVQGGSGHH